MPVHSKKNTTKKNTKKGTKRPTKKRLGSKKVGKRSTLKRTTKTVGKRKRPTPRQVPNYKKRDYARPSPAVSATLYPAGKRMRGNDGNWYKISIGTRGIHRWIKA